MKLTVLFLGICCLTTLPFVPCISTCQVFSFAAEQMQDHLVLLNWKVKGRCHDRYTIRYFSITDNKNYYKSGNVSDGNVLVDVAACSNYMFVLVQYTPNGRQKGSKSTTLSTGFAFPSAPLEPQLYIDNRHTLTVSWNPPDDNKQCVMEYVVELFRAQREVCIAQICTRPENVFQRNVIATTTTFTIGDLICTDYRLYVWSNFGIYTSNTSVARLDFSLPINKNVTWADTKFNLLQNKVYFLATFNWTLPEPLLICFPNFEIQACFDKTCNNFPASLNSRIANISDLMLDTSYTVNFLLINSDKSQLIGRLLMQTEREIPSARDFVVNEVHPQSAKLNWTIPDEMSDLKHLLNLTLRENSGFFEANTVSGDNKVALTNLMPCWTYNISLTVNYKEYSSKPVSAILNTTEPSGAIYSVKNLRATNISQTTVELSWLSQFSHCYLGFEVQFNDDGSQISYFVNSTKAIIKNLTSCTTYTFYIYTINRKGELKQSDFIQIETLFGENLPVGNLTAVARRTDGFVLQWELPLTSHCISLYVVYIYKVREDTSMSIVSKYEVNINEESKLITSLEPCSRYLAKVVSSWRATQGQQSEIFTDTLTQGPGEVLSLKAVVLGTNIQLRWEHPQKARSCLSFYEIKWQEMYPQNSNSSVLQVPGTENIVTVKNLTACTKFKFSIRSVVVDGNSSKFISTFAETSSVVLHVLSGRVTNATAYSLQITWLLETDKCPIVGFLSFCFENNRRINPSLSKEVSFRTFIHQYENLMPETLYRCFGDVYNEGGVATRSKELTAQTTPLRNTFSNSIIVSTLTSNSCGQLVCVIRDQSPAKTRVRRYLSIFDDIVNYLFPEDVNTNVPSEPTAVKVLNVTATSVFIVWSPPRSSPAPITGYLITRSNIILDYFVPSSCNQTLIANSTDSVPVNVTEYLLVGLRPYTKFDITVEAVIGNVSGPSSSPVSITTLPDVPDQVRNLHVFLGQNQTVLSWYMPCLTHGVLSHFHASMSGTKTKYPSVPQKEWIIPKKENTEQYQEVLVDLLPEYDYEINITAVVYNVSKVNTNMERFQCPAGIPPEPDMTTSNIIFTILSSSKVIVTFSYNLFNDTQGQIKYYALLLTKANLSQLSQSGWLGTNRSWPQENTWAEARLKNDVNSYQATPLYWYPFKNTLEAQYTLGQDSCSLEDTASYCNGPLLGHTTYLLRIRAFTASGYRDTISVAFTTEGPVNYVILISLTLLVLIIILTITYLAITGLKVNIIKKRKKKKKIVDEVKQTDLTVGPPPLSAKNFLLHCNSVLENPGKIKEEFDLLISQSSKVTSPISIALQPHNRKKNRYVNILPYDSNRVVLEGESDYINASYIKFQGEEKYNIDFIACQAPKDDYCHDFWKMICQCNVDVIIMLCNFVEDKKEKCSSYFPSLGEVVTFGDISILCKIQTESPHHILRVFAVTQNDIQRTVHHCHCTEWPDFGIPSSPEVMLRFCETTRATGKEHTLAVHCSAGVGRTGTYIALVVLLKHLKHKKKLSVFATILNMRKQRPHMVQTQEQYKYIYDCLKFDIEHQRTALKGNLRSEKSTSKDQIALKETPTASTEDHSNM